MSNGLNQVVADVIRRSRRRSRRGLYSCRWKPMFHCCVCGVSKGALRRNQTAQPAVPGAVPARGSDNDAFCRLTVFDVRRIDEGILLEDADQRLVVVDPVTGAPIVRAVAENVPRDPDPRLEVVRYRADRSGRPRASSARPRSRPLSGSPVPGTSAAHAALRMSAPLAGSKRPGQNVVRTLFLSVIGG